MYKSKVFIYTGDAVYAALCDVFNKNDFGPDKAEDIFGGFKCSTFEWCAWTNEYPEVRAVYRTLGAFASAEENDEQFAYCLVRVGEAPGDVEVIANAAGEKCFNMSETERNGLNFSEKPTFDEKCIVSLLSASLVKGKSPLLFFKQTTSFLSWQIEEKGEGVFYELFEYDRGCNDVVESGYLTFKKGGETPDKARTGYLVLKKIFGEDIPSFTVLQ